MLRHPAFIVRIYAGSALVHWGQEAVPDMVACIREPYPFIDEVQVSGKHGNEQGRSLKGYLCMALTARRPRGQNGARGICAGCQDPEDVRFGAVAGLGFLGSKESLPALRKVAAGDIVWAIRQSASDVIAEIELMGAAGMAVARHD